MGGGLESQGPISAKVVKEKGEFLTSFVRAVLHEKGQGKECASWEGRQGGEKELPETTKMRKNFSGMGKNPEEEKTQRRRWGKVEVNSRKGNFCEEGKSIAFIAARIKETEGRVKKGRERKRRSLYNL